MFLSARAQDLSEEPQFASCLPGLAGHHRAGPHAFLLAFAGRHRSHQIQIHDRIQVDRPPDFLAAQTFLFPAKFFCWFFWTPMVGLQPEWSPVFKTVSAMSHKH